MRSSGGKKKTKTSAKKFVFSPEARYSRCQICARLISATRFPDRWKLRVRAPSRRKIDERSGVRGRRSGWREREREKEGKEKWEGVWSTGYRRFNLRAMGPVTIWDSGDSGEVIDYHGTDLPPPSSLFSFRLPSPILPLALPLFLSRWPPTLASRTDAKIYTWRLLRRCTLVWMEAGHSNAGRRELWNEKYMVSKRTAVGRSSKGERANGSERHKGQRGKEKEGHSTREKKNAIGGESGSRDVCKKVCEERIRGEKDSRENSWVCPGLGAPKGRIRFFEFSRPARLMRVERS